MICVVTRLRQCLCQQQSIYRDAESRGQCSARTAGHFRKWPAFQHACTCSEGHATAAYACMLTSASGTAAKQRVRMRAEACVYAPTRQCLAAPCPGGASEQFFKCFASRPPCPTGATPAATPRCSADPHARAKLCSSHVCQTPRTASAQAAPRASWWSPSSTCAWWTAHRTSPRCGTATRLLESAAYQRLTLAPSAARHCPTFSQGTAARAPAWATLLQRSSAARRARRRATRRSPAPPPRPCRVIALARPRQWRDPPLRRSRVALRWWLSRRG